MAEAVIEIGVGDQVASCQYDLRHHVRACDLRLAVVDLGSQRETAGLGAVGEDAVHAFAAAGGGLRDQVGLLVRQDDRALERQADAFAEQHLGERQPVVRLGPEHVRFVGLDLDLQGVRFRHDAGGDGFLHILLQRAEQIGVGVRQFLLGGDGDNLPVGLVHIHDHVGISLVVPGRLQLLGQPGHLVGIHDLAAHEHGLLQGDRGGKEVVAVQMQGVVHFGPDGVDRARDVRCLELLQVRLFQHAEHGLPHRTERVFEHEFGIVLDLFFQLGAHRLGLLSDLGLRIGVGLVQGALRPVAQAAQRGRLAVADQRDVAVVVLVGAGGGNVGEIVGQRHFPVIAGHLDGGLRLLQAAAGPDGHPAAVLQGQHLLRRHGAADQQETKRYKVIASFHLFCHKSPRSGSITLP